MPSPSRLAALVPGLIVLGLIASAAPAQSPSVLPSTAEAPTEAAPGLDALIARIQGQPESVGSIAASGQTTPPGGDADNVGEIPVRGLVRPARQATLSSTRRARIIAVHVREGERFAQDSVLAELDCRADEAERAIASALRNEREVAVRSGRYLKRMKAGSADELAIAEARLEQSDAEIRALDIRIDGCAIRAPFAGMVREIHARAGEFAVEGTPIVSVLDPVNPEIELIAASSLLRDLKPGLRFDFRSDETGKTHAAIIRAIAPNIDAVSQTIKVYARFADEPLEIMPGMSGDASFDRRQSGK